MSVCCVSVFFFFKQKTAYEMRISDWSSDVCSSDLLTMLLTLVFLIPVSIPGVSTVFGAAILLVGISRLIGRPLWLPARLRDKALPADRLRPGLTGGMTWVRWLERISRQIGRASCRERGCPYVWISVGAGTLKKRKERA